MRCFFHSSMKSKCRCIGYLSADRNRQEQIKDRQASFQWSKYHIFRPHQHFTYDPTSWNRQLRESDKVMIPQTIRKRKEIKQYGIIEKREENTSSSSVRAESSIQQQVRQLESLYEYLCSKRYRNSISEKKKEYLSKQLSGIVLGLYRGICNANINALSISLASRVCVWSLLLEHIETLLNSLNESSEEYSTMVSLLNDEPITKNSLNTQESSISVISSIYFNLKESIFLNLSLRSLRLPLNSVESCIDLCFILLHPFTHQSVEKYENGENGKVYELLSFTCVTNMISQTTEMLGYRILQVKYTSVGPSEELLSPSILRNWSLVIMRFISTYSRHLLGNKNLINKLLVQLCLINAREAASLLRILKTSLPQQLALNKSLLPFAHTSATKKSSQKKGDIFWSSNRFPHNNYGSNSVLPIETTTHPLGIQKPQTNPDDVSLIMMSSINLFDTLTLCQTVLSIYPVSELSIDLHSIQLMKAIKSCVSALFDLLIFTPNYDIEPHLLVELCVRCLESPFSFLNNSSNVDTHSKEYLSIVFLTLSRVSVESKFSIDPLKLCKLFFLIGEINTSSQSPFMNAEFGRLRGIILSRLFNTLTVDNFLSFDKISNTPLLFILRLNNAKVQTPLWFWKDMSRICGVWPSEDNSSKLSTQCITRDTAVALLQIRERCPNSDMDLNTVKCIAQCLQISTALPHLAKELLTCPSKWESIVTNEASGGDLNIFKQCKAFVAQLQSDAEKTVFFSHP